MPFSGTVTAIPSSGVVCFLDPPLHSLLGSFAPKDFAFPFAVGHPGTLHNWIAPQKPEAGTTPSDSSTPHTNSGRQCPRRRRDREAYTGGCPPSRLGASPSGQSWQAPSWVRQSRAGNGVCPGRCGSRSIWGTGPREPGNAWAAPGSRRRRRLEPAAQRVRGRGGPSGLDSLGSRAELSRRPGCAQPAELRGR